ncbi:hypothetical protein HMPREF9093_01388 [Fusobacterium sp. oral taxon 370 str. F0437]|nr:hypothetical protein HMPREF9093_01388 [Fusobacterium sp. oral taxon 370 str. F0437]
MEVDIKKLKFLMLFCLFGSMLLAAQKTTKAVKNEYDLKFNPNKYISKQIEVNGKKLNIVHMKILSMLKNLWIKNTKI